MGRRTGARGTTEIRGHCTFEWSESLSGGRRLVYIGARHCHICLGELRESAAASGLAIVEILLPDLPPGATEAHG